MNCLKCGRETEAEQVFCEDCHLEMQKYPVKPGTLVFLPRRREAPVLKKMPKRKAIPLEDQVRSLRQMVKYLVISLVVCICLILSMLYPAIHFWVADHYKTGQNYTTIIPNTGASQNP